MPEKDSRRRDRCTLPVKQWRKTMRFLPLPKHLQVSFGSSLPHFAQNADEMYAVGRRMDVWHEIATQIPID